MKKLLLASVASAMPIAFANAAAKPRIEPALTAVSNKVPMPVRENKRGSKSSYPFDSLTAVGMSFGVTNKTAANLSSIVSNANRKAIKPKLDEAGKPIFKTNPVKDANGAIVGQTPTTEAETIVTAHYFVIDTDPKTDPDKATARVFRDA